MRDLTKRDLGRIAIMACAGYAGALIGQIVFMFAAGHIWGREDASFARLFADVVGPLASVTMALTTPGPNLAILATVVAALMLRKRAWAVAVVAVVLGFGAATCWCGMAWKTG